MGISLCDNIKEIPAIAEIDMTDMADVAGYTHLLLAYAQTTGTPDAELSMLMRRAADTIRHRISAAPAEHLRQLFESYDILYRLGYRQAPPQRIADECRRRYFDSWVAGNHTITQGDIYAMLSPAAFAPLRHSGTVTPSHGLTSSCGIFSGAPGAITPSHGLTSSCDINAHTSPRDIDARQFAACYTIREEWIAQLRNRPTFAGVPLAENYLRLSLLMREDLRAWFRFDQRSRKRLWVDRNRPADLSALDTPTLLAYRTFVLTLWPAVTPIPSLNRATQAPVLAALLSRPDLNPYERRALEMIALFF